MKSHRAAEHSYRINVAKESHFPLFGRAIFRTPFFPKNAFLWLLKGVSCCFGAAEKLLGVDLYELHIICTTMITFCRNIDKFVANFLQYFS